MLGYVQYSQRTGNCGLYPSTGSDHGMYSKTVALEEVFACNFKLHFVENLAGSPPPPLFFSGDSFSSVPLPKLLVDFYSVVDRLIGGNSIEGWPGSQKRISDFQKR